MRMEICINILFIYHYGGIWRNEFIFHEISGESFWWFRKIFVTLHAI